MFSRETYEKRRLMLKKKIEEGVIILCGNQLLPMNYKNNTFPFVQDSSFLYYFGINEPNLVGLIDIDNNVDILFGDELKIEDLIWSGPIQSLDIQMIKTGADKVLPLDSIGSYLKDILNQGRKVHYVNQYVAENILNISDWLNIPAKEVNKYLSESLSYAIAEQRNTKSPEELREITKAVNLTREMHLKAMEFVKPGMKEIEVVNFLEKIVKENNATLAFQSICTINGHYLHSKNYNNILKDGDLLLIDAGAKIGSGYCGDMTTTFPVSKEFSDIQKEIYDLLISMFEKGEELIAPGITYVEVHLEICKILTEGLIEKKILKGNVDEIVENGVHALFMPHGIGHMLGLDTHDMESIGEKIVGYNGETKSSQFGLSSLRLGRVLEEDFVVTLEPGIYFIPELIEKWKKEEKFLEYIDYETLEEYKSFTGMRYEGNFIVTRNGNRRIGDTMVKHARAIEEIRKKAFL